MFFESSSWSGRPRWPDLPGPIHADKCYMWWFQTFSLFSPFCGEIIQFDGRIFFNKWFGGEKPSTTFSPSPVHCLITKSARLKHTTFNQRLGSCHSHRSSPTSFQRLVVEATSWEQGYRNTNVIGIFDFKGVMTIVQVKLICILGLGQKGPWVDRCCSYYKTISVAFMMWL